MLEVIGDIAKCEDRQRIGYLVKISSCQVLLERNLCCLYLLELSNIS